MEDKYVCLVVPTGIGASIGGYAGDASCVARKFSKQRKLIVNPNVVNAAVFSGINENILYVEGSMITELLKGTVSLKKSESNKIGVIFDKKIPQDVINIHINTINALQTVYSFNFIGYEITKENAGVDFYTTTEGISTGSVKNEQTLLEAGKKLLGKGADALAVVCFFEEPPVDDYEQGEGVDIVGGIEAVISHYLSQKLKVPCVHAPAFADYTISSDVVSPKVSAEYITPTFLPCLFFGLNNAPLIADYNEKNITYKNISHLILPYNALGSSIVFSALQHGIPVIAVKENRSVLNIEKDVIFTQNDIIVVDTYDECLKLINKD